MHIYIYICVYIYIYIYIHIHTPQACAGAVGAPTVDVPIFCPSLSPSSLPLLLQPNSTSNNY